MSSCNDSRTSNRLSGKPPNPNKAVLPWTARVPVLLAVRLLGGSGEMRPLRSAIRLPACDARAAQFESQRMEPGGQSQNIPVQSAQTNAAAPPKRGNVRRSRPLRVLDVQ